MRFQGDELILSAYFFPFLPSVLLALYGVALVMLQRVQFTAALGGAAVLAFGCYLHMQRARRAADCFLDACELEVRRRLKILAPRVRVEQPPPEEVEIEVEAVSRPERLRE
jgi:hypothetical protein